MYYPRSLNLMGSLFVLFRSLPIYICLSTLFVCRYRIFYIGYLFFFYFLLLVSGEGGVGWCKNERKFDHLVTHGQREKLKSVTVMEFYCSVTCTGHNITCMGFLTDFLLKMEETRHKRKYLLVDLPPAAYFDEGETGEGRTAA